MMIVQPPAIMNHREDWNRADSTSLGSDWRLDFNTMKIATNRVQFKTPANGDGRAGAWATYVKSTAYNGGRLLTDNWAVESQLIAPVGNAATDNMTSIGVGQVDSGTFTLIYFGITTSTFGSGILTRTASSIPSPGTTDASPSVLRTSTTTAVSPTATLRLERRMYSATQSVFTAFVNGSSFLSWDDSGAAVPAGDRLRRRWFIVQEGNYPVFQSPFYSPAQDWVRTYDLMK
jgi:hypothetical protein